jgi:hypothetical protein
MRFPVGTKFVRIGKKTSAAETVVDFHVTRNLAGEIVKERYVTTREFCGQEITDNDVCETTIARGVYRATDAIS